MQERRDDEPNKALARELVETNNIGGIQEIAENLWHKDKRVQSDCDSVLEEIGRIKPTLICDYVLDYINLLSSKNNRMVWGSMINLSLIGDIVPEVIFEHLETIIHAVDKGSIITQDSGILTLAKVASVRKKYNQVIFPYLVNQLKTCRIKSVAQYAESTFYAVNSLNQAEFIRVLDQRLDSLSGPQQKRVRKLLRKIES